MSWLGAEGAKTSNFGLDVKSYAGVRPSLIRGKRNPLRPPELSCPVLSARAIGILAVRKKAILILCCNGPALHFT